LQIRQNNRNFGKIVAMPIVQYEIPDTEPLKVCEPDAPYGINRYTDYNPQSVMISTIKTDVISQKQSGINRWIGSNEIFASSIFSDFDIVNAIPKGIPKSSVDELATHLGITRKSMAEDILDLSVKTLERKAPSDKLDKKTSSHVLEVAKIMQHGFAVFEDEDRLKRWLNKENRALNGMKPIDLFGSMTGLNMVNDILGRIEEGVYS
jgi:putative toxin-antitoxin system antitoxin component (TIGR02293 family)